MNQYIPQGVKIHTNISVVRGRKPLPWARALRVAHVAVVTGSRARARSTGADRVSVRGVAWLQVRTQRAKIKFEIACYPNKVQEWRDGV